MAFRTEGLVVGSFSFGFWDFRIRHSDMSFLQKIRHVQLAYLFFFFFFFFFFMSLTICLLPFRFDFSFFA